MCGIVGFVSPRGLPEGASSILRQMADRIAHRGPDDAGDWIDEEAGVALAHRRLSILDLSPAGHQPMASASGRYHIIFNGEIYNHLALRREIETAGGAPEWRGHSDTEVMLAAFERWGIEESLRRFEGMFAFALWDRANRILYLARDRLGEKPLYYGKFGDTYLFSSEIKAIRPHPDFSPKVDRSALTLFVRHNYIPAPRSIWAGLSKLPPAHYLRIDPRSGKAETPRSYWDFGEIVEQGIANPIGDEQEAVEMLDKLLRNAVSSCMEADVPLGAFLSGGIDSSTIVALMQEQSSRSVKTFSIGFHEKEYDESAHAKAVANHLGTEHTELFVTPRDALAVIPKLPHIWDEPFSDASQIPTYLLSSLTRQHVTVSLSGDAGDELFGGYERYFAVGERERNLARIPIPVRSVLGQTLQTSAVSAIAGLIDSRLAGLRALHLLDRLPALGRILSGGNGELYREFVSHWKNPAALVLRGEDSTTAFDQSYLAARSIREAMMIIDTLSYLPDDILVKVDRASMAASLESRAPFLNHHVVEFAWRLPMSQKIRGNTGKWALRQVLYRYVPAALVDRPKMGFGVPIDNWLRGHLRDWAENLLSVEKLRNDGFFDYRPIRKKWEEHVKGEHDWHYYLWDILMFQAWWDAQEPSWTDPSLKPSKPEFQI
jgi:asparagine synthase (glutamine-hydrolysing)